MKISQLIKHLENTKRYTGDVDVYFFEDAVTYSLFDVTFVESQEVTEETAPWTELYGKTILTLHSGKAITMDDPDYTDVNFQDVVNEINQGVITTI